jgi:hypothetical protein
MPIRLINWKLSFFLRFPFGSIFAGLFASVSASLRSRAALHLEILALRHQLGVSSPLRKAAQAHPCGSIFVGWAVRRLEWLALQCLPRQTFDCHWLASKGLSSVLDWNIRRGKLGRPAAPREVRALIRAMSRDNPLWGAPRIHGELLKLGIDIGETSISKYMVRRRKPPSQTWRTFLENHVKSMVSVDFFTVPRDCLYNE